MLRVWHKVIYDVVRNRGQMVCSIPRFGSLERVPHLTGSSLAIGKTRALCGIAGALVGIYLNSTAALAEIEEVSEDFGGAGNSISTLASGLSIEYDHIDAGDVGKLDEQLIPETVWSLHDSPATHLDRIRDGVSSQIYTGFDPPFENIKSWTKTAIASRNGNSTFTSAGISRVHPLQFQVASCGGSRAERKDLDYCSIDDIILNEESAGQSISSENNDASNAVKNVDDSAILSTGAISSTGALIHQ